MGNLGMQTLLLPKPAAPHLIGSAKCHVGLVDLRGEKQDDSPFETVVGKAIKAMKGILDKFG